MLEDIILIKNVSDICTLKSPLSSEINTTLPLIAFYMNLMKVEAAGVVDENNHCIGFVTSDDVINYLDADKQSEQTPCVADVMRAPNMSVYLDDPIGQALIMMNLHEIDWLPVIDSDTRKFSGLICRKDIDDLPSNIIPFMQRNFFWKSGMRKRKEKYYEHTNQSKRT